MDQIDVPNTARSPSPGPRIDYFPVQAFADKHKLSYNETAAMVRAALADAAPAIADTTQGGPQANDLDGAITAAVISINTVMRRLQKGNTDGALDVAKMVKEALVQALAFLDADKAESEPGSEDAFRFKNACSVHTNFAVMRYLMSNTDGRLDGAEKSLRHMELCRFYTSVFSGDTDIDHVRHQHEDLFQVIHTKTQELTDYLDEQIGFPLNGRPDYDALAPLFFDRFHALALDASRGHMEGGAK